MDIIKSCIKYINYPFAMLLRDNWPRITSYHSCIAKQFRPLEENIREQKEQLYDIVEYAVNNIPYYRDFALENQLTFSKDTITEDIKQLPILTKEIIRKEGNRLYNSELKDYYIATSGGSTGEPIKLRHDQYLNKVFPGNYLLSYAGYDIGDKVVLLWGSERDILQGSIGLKARISNIFVTRRRLLNSFRMTREDMFDYVHTINKWKPKVILAYTQSIYELALFIKREELDIYSPKGIVVSAGTLYDDWANEIKEVFRCPVINQYGSRETPGIAISCAESSELHINTFMNYVEVVDDQGNNLPCGVDGNIIVTNLINRSMPLIRYKIGDVGALSSKEKCKCGRNLPCLLHVSGRTVNIFKRRDGTKIDGEYFTHLFYGISEVERFQVIQTDYEKIEIKIQSLMPLSEKKEKEIRKNICAVMGNSCDIEIEYLSEIVPTKSGKYLYTISMI